MNTFYIQKLILIITLVFFQACEDKKEEIKETVTKIQKKTIVDVNIIEKKAYPIWINFSGKTQALKNVSITSRVHAELKEILFQEGSSVKKGDVLFKLDNTEYKITLLQKKANLKKTQASLNLAISNVRRYKPLVKKQLVSREKLDELISIEKQLEAQVEVDIASVNQAKLNLEYCLIKATINGQIGKSTLDIGNIVSTSSSLVNIVQTSSLYVNFNPSSNVVSLIKKYRSLKNPKIIVYPENMESDLKIEGEITFFDNVTNEQTGTVAIRAIIKNENNILFPGTFVNIKVLVSDKIPLIAISSNSISQNQLGSYVLIVDENNQIKTKQITISHSTDDFSIIKKGLKINDKIIVSAINKLQNDQVVQTNIIQNLIKK
ncbi:MAG: efflux RND transporter periplasmic adaptor subunit [Campylobacteraceae bacterium]|nr:efflux RND transporter periplasmic adaptor subunit [Campylobacteraceae bacterium]